MTSGFTPGPRVSRLTGTTMKAPDEEAIPAAIAAVRDRHLAYYKDLLSMATDELTAPIVTSAQFNGWQDQLGAEIDNVRAALAWALNSDQIEVGLELYGMSSWVWRSSLHEGRLWGERLVATGGGSDRARARCLLVLADILRRIGESPAGVDRMREALRLAQRQSDPTVNLLVLVALAGSIMFEESAECVQRYQEALDLLSAIPDPPPWQVAECLRGVAWGKMLLGEHDDRARLFSEARRVLDESGSRLAVALHLAVEANLHLWYGDGEAQRRCREEALTILIDEGFDTEAASLNLQMADQDLDEERLEEAEARFADVFERSKGERPVTTRAGSAVTGLALVAAWRGEESRARVLAADAIKRFGEVEVGHGLNMETLFQARRLAATLARSNGQIEEARRLTLETIQMAMKIGARAYAAGDLRTLADAELDAGNKNDAIPMLERAASLFEDDLQGSLNLFADATARAELVSERDGAEAAAPIIEEALAGSTDWSPVHRAGLRGQLARILLDSGRAAQARELIEEVLASGAVPHGVYIRARLILVGALSAALLDDADAVHDALGSLGHRWRAFSMARLRCETLDAVAWSAAREERWEEAAELLGAAAAYRALTRTGARDVLRPIPEQAETAARAGLGDEGFDDAFARGEGRWRELLAKHLG